MDRYSSHHITKMLKNKHDMIELRQKQRQTQKGKFPEKISNPICFSFRLQLIVAYCTPRKRAVYISYGVRVFVTTSSSPLTCCCFSSFATAIPDMLSLFSLCTHFVRELDIEQCKSGPLRFLATLFSSLRIWMIGEKSGRIEKRHVCAERQISWFKQRARRSNHLICSIYPKYLHNIRHAHKKECDRLKELVVFSGCCRRRRHRFFTVAHV